VPGRARCVQIKEDVISLPPTRAVPYPWLAIVYFAAYIGYLFGSLESELGHWIGLVALPALLTALALRLARHPASPRAVLTSFGLAPGHLRDGVWWAFLIGLGMGAAQLAISRQRTEFLALVESGRAYWLLPLAFVLMLATAAFTEEFFFRGFLQARLEQITHSRVAAVLMASVAFGLYHLPYAYLNPNWPSAGDWSAAWTSAMTQGVMGGLVLGAVFLGARRNLVAPIVVHACINAFPASLVIRFS
jgi:membrane protease YdiL (CAAX protease family)